MNAANQKLVAAGLVCFGRHYSQKLAEVRSSTATAETKSEVAKSVILDMASKLRLRVTRDYHWLATANGFWFASVGECVSGRVPHARRRVRHILPSAVLR